MQRRLKSDPHTIRLGFVALADCAPIVMARELGLYRKHGLDVEIRREVGWATVRDKIIYGELEAAHAPAGLVVAASCGLNCVQTECLTGLILNIHGNAITLSQQLWKSGIRNGEALRAEIARRERLFVFAVVHGYSSHNFLLRQWLRDHHIHPDRDVQIVIVPPAQVYQNLRTGHIDGYCVGEPWNSLAVMSNIGWCVATSEELAPGHPEKVLMVRKSFADGSEHSHLRLIAALLEACAFCDAPENRERIIETLAQPECVNAPIQALRMSMAGSFNYGNGRVEKHSSFHIFSRDNANEPTLERAQWLVGQLHQNAVADPETVPESRAPEWFRNDIYRQARHLN